MKIRIQNFMESRKGRLTVLVFIVALMLIRFAQIYPWVAVPNYDFDLHYFGGMVERSGTFADTTSILNLAKDAGSHVSTEGVYGGPTLVAFIYQPLSLLQLEIAQKFWALFSICFLAFAVRRATGNYWWPAWFGVALLSGGNLIAIGNGNFAIMTTALLLFSYGSLRDGKHRQAGVALAIAAACKLYPAFLILVLIVKKERQALKWTLGPLVLMLAATPLALSWQDTDDAIRRTLGISSFVHPWIHNVGLPGFVLHTTDNQTLAQWTSRALLVASSLFIFALRKRTSTDSLFAMALLLLALSQSISWITYFGVTMAAAICIVRSKRGPITYISVAIAYLMANGTPGSEVIFQRSYHYAVGLALLILLMLAHIHRQSVDESSNHVRSAQSDRNRGTSIQNETAFLPTAFTSLVRRLPSRRHEVNDSPHTGQ